MKCVVDKGGRPDKRVFMRVGKAAVMRPDNLNWSVEVDDQTSYHTTLPKAIRRAVEVAAENKARDAQEWLENYAHITGNLERKLAQAMKAWVGAE